MLCERFTIAFGTPEMLKSMFSSSIARLNLSASSRFLRWPSSCTLCELPSTGFSVRSWFLRTRFFIFHRFARSIWRTKFSLWLTNNLLGHRLPRSIFNGFRELGWLGRTRLKCFSPSDCWTSFPTGWCSTVEPWSFPSVQLRSRLKEIFGGGRGGKYCLSYNFSPLFNLSTCTIQWAGGVPWRIIALDLVW